MEFITVKGKKRRLFEGKNGGQYYLTDSGNKRYISKKQEKTESKIKVKCCCVCGNPLRRDDCEYYDLSDYCPRCALADGIITSLE